MCAIGLLMTIAATRMGFLARVLKIELGVIQSSIQVLAPGRTRNYPSAVAITPLRRSLKLCLRPEPSATESRVQISGSRSGIV